MSRMPRLPIKEYIDASTGERFYAEQIANEYYGQSPFWKMYREEFVALLKKYDGKQKDILLYIIMHIRQSDNSFHSTYKKISKELNVSEVTIAKTLTSLQDDRFITIETIGVWKINPNFIMRGGEQKRKILSKIFFDLWNVRDIIRKKHTNKTMEGDFNE